MKINIVSYLFHEADTGGGGMVRRALMEEGIRRGHALQFSHVRPRPKIQTHAKPDLWILADIWNLPWHWKRSHRRILTQLPWTGAARYRRVVRAARESGNFVHIDNSYVDVCDLPYLPCNGSVVGSVCPFKKGLFSFQRKCFRQTTQNIYRRSRVNFYVSPLHAKVINEFLGLSSDRSLVLDPVLDPRPFLAAADSTREIPLLFAGPFNEAKGSAEIKRRWPNGEVRIVGPMTREASSYRGYAGATPYSDMPSLLKKTQTFVFHPRWPEPFGRVVSEAVLSGCKLDANERVGALSFGVDLGDPTFYKDAAAKFWLTIESLRT